MAPDPVTSTEQWRREREVQALRRVVLGGVPTNNARVQTAVQIILSSLIGALDCL